MTLLFAFNQVSAALKLGSKGIKLSVIPCVTCRQFWF